MFAEYALVVSNNAGLIWGNQIRPLLDNALSSPFFWPGVAAAVVVLLWGWNKL